MPGITAEILPRIEYNQGNRQEIYPLPTDTDYLEQLQRHIFDNHWPLRLFNGDGTPQLNVFFPNPFLTDEDDIAEQPDWSRLDVWDDIARRFLGRRQLQDPLDRSGRGFRAP